MPASDQGASSGRYALIPRTLIFVRRGEKVLLLRGAAHKRLWAGKYNGLGGHVERGEDVLGAARRELAEETGLAADLRLIGVVTVDAGPGVGIGLFVLSGECAIGEPAASDEGLAEWVDPKDLAGLPLVEDLPALLPVVLASQPGDAPFSAHSAYDSDGKLTVTFSA